MVFDPQFFTSLLQDYWIAGAFLVGFLSSFTIFLPTPAFLVIFAMASTFNPILLGIFAGAGAAVGELTGYVIGYGSKKVLLEKKHNKLIEKTQRAFEKYKPSVLIFVFAVTPLPFDIIGLLCGAIDYPIKRFFLITLVGKIIKYLAIAFAGAYSIGWVSQWISW